MIPGRGFRPAGFPGPLGLGWGLAPLGHEKRSRSGLLADSGHPSTPGPEAHRALGS